MSYIRKKRYFYDFMRLARKALDIPLEEAAYECNITTERLYKMETGELSMPKYIIEHLYDYYDIDKHFAPKKPGALKEIILKGWFIYDGKLIKA